MKKNEISILGSGLTGSLLSIYLKRRGLSVDIYEKRADNRKGDYKEEGRSINLALSDRGWKALKDLGLTEKVEPLTIPMYGRKIHNEHGKTSFIPYGKEGQAIYSISRGRFNQLLMEEAEAEGVQIHFEHKIEDVNLRDNTLLVSNPEVKKPNHKLRSHHWFRWCLFSLAKCHAEAGSV